MFKGEYNHTIDEKGRLIVPSKFRNSLGEGAVTTKELDGCLSIYTKDSWEVLEEKLSTLPKTDIRARELKRFYLGGACDLEIDKQGRALIPTPLREFAKLTDAVSFIGVGDHIEIWNDGDWKKKGSSEALQNIAESMEGLGI